MTEQPLDEKMPRANDLEGQDLAFDTADGAGLPHGEALPADPDAPLTPERPTDIQRPTED